MSIDKTVIVTQDDSPGKNQKNPPPPHSSDIATDAGAVTPETIQFQTKELEQIPPVQSIYNIENKFAEGGQGIISKGRDHVLQRYVAIKSLKSDYYENEDIIKNFVTEAKITAQLDHPSIIPLYAIHSSAVDKGLHIAMKLIHGQTLKELNEDTVLLCKQYRKTKIKSIEKIVLHERLEDFLKVCDAISFAHSRNVIHRDLKPENIMIGEFHEVYVMDWGIATPYDKQKESGPKDQNKTISGTPGYIAPELVVGGNPNPLSDQYSLGMILFELMTLKPAITGETIKEVFYKTRDGQLEPMKHRFDGCVISKDLMAIVKKATAVEPENRYPSVEELADDIRHFLLNEELIARPDNIPRKCTRWAAKHKNIVASAILMLLLCLSGIAIYGLIQKNRAEKESKIRAVKLVKLHSSIEDRAHAIDRHFFHIAHILSRFADNASSALEGKELENKKIYFPTSAFTKKSNLPPGTQYSKAYKREIDLSAFNYSLAPGLTFKNAELQIKKIATLRPELFKYFVNSDPDALTLENIEAGEKKAIDKGFPIKWMYVALKNGLMVNYPGSSGAPEDYDPRKRPWYKKTEKIRRQHWSKPYIDSFGLGLVISASKSLYDSKGNFQGVASIDMTFDYITNTLMKPQVHHKSVETRYLITKNGDIILSSRLASREVKKATRHDTEVIFPPFPFPEIKKHIKEASSGQFETKSNGRVVLIGYALIKTLHCYYVEEINLNQYLGKE